MMKHARGMASEIYFIYPIYSQQFQMRIARELIARALFHAQSDNHRRAINRRGRRSRGKHAAHAIE